MTKTGVTITAALAWYDEPPALLRRCVQSLEGLVDRIVAVDGGYTLIDGATAESPRAQAVAIRETAKRSKIAVDIQIPDKPWRGQVEKRDAMMKIAADNTDWILVVDADYEIRCPNPLHVRRELRHTSADALAVDFHTPMPKDEPEHDIFAHAWHENLAGRTVKTHLLFRALPGIRVERHHWWYSAEKRGTRVGLWGCGGLYPPARRKNLRTQLRIDHHCLTRSPELIERNRAYIAKRKLIVDKTGLEP